jgi:hypothetical protein
VSYFSPSDSQAFLDEFTDKMILDLVNERSRLLKVNADLLAALKMSREASEARLDGGMAEYVKLEKAAAAAVIAAIAKAEAA